MTTYFSDNIALATAPTVFDKSFRATVGIRHGRKRIAVARSTTADSTGFQTTDVVRMIQLRSGDRLHKLELVSDGVATAGAINVGLYLSGSAHDGAVVDVDLFMSAQVISTALDLTDALIEAALSGVDRGKTLWEQAAVGAGSDTEDPFVNYDIAIVPSTNFDDDNQLLLIAEYTSGD